MAASMHTHNFCNAVTLVWGSLRLVPFILLAHSQYPVITLTQQLIELIICITCKILVPKYCGRQLNTKVCNIEIDPLLDALSYHKHDSDVQF